MIIESADVVVTSPGRSLEPYDLFWLEDCIPAENQEALRLVRSHTITPLAIGEVFNSVPTTGLPVNRLPDGTVHDW